MIALDILVAVVVLWGMWTITAPSEADCALDDVAYTLGQMHGTPAEKPSWRCP